MVTFWHAPLVFFAETGPWHGRFGDPARNARRKSHVLVKRSLEI